MKDFVVMGIDPSSTICGVSIVKNGEPLIITHHQSDKKLDLGRRIFEFGAFLRNTKAKFKINLVAVEEDSVARNLNTVRKISYFEGMALCQAGAWGVPTLLMKPSTARKFALGKGNGNLNKEKVFEIMSKKYSFSDGKPGLDECDSLVVALGAYKKEHGEK